MFWPEAEISGIFSIEVAPNRLSEDFRGAVSELKQVDSSSRYPTWCPLSYARPESYTTQMLGEVQATIHCQNQNLNKTNLTFHILSYSLQYE